MLSGRPVKYDGEAGMMRPCESSIGGRDKRSMGGAAMDARWRVVVWRVRRWVVVRRWWH